MDLHAPRLAEFLARQTGKQFCTTCLASEVACRIQDVRSALATVAADIGLNWGAGRCASCQGWNLVYGVFAPDADVRAPEERLADFLGARLGTFYCNTCLSSKLGLSPYVMRKAIDRLRMAGTASLQGGRCRVCERLRLVVGRPAGEEGGTLRPGIA